MRRQKTRLEQLQERPTLSESVDEDRMIVWDTRSEALTGEQRDLICGLLTLDGPEVCDRNRARWAEIADEARRAGRSRDRAVDEAISEVLDG